MNYTDEELLAIVNEPDYSDQELMDIAGIKPPERELSMMDKLAGFGTKALSGATFNAGDEIVARLSSLHPDVTYDQALEFERAKQEEFSDKDPYLSAAAEIGGALTTGGVGAAKLGLGQLAQGASKLGTAGRAAGIGGISGGAYGFGGGQGGVGERFENAGKGGAYGLVAGTASYPLAVGASRLTKSLTDRAKRLFQKTSQSSKSVSLQELAARQADNQAVQYTGEESAVMNKIYNDLKKDFGDDADAVLKGWLDGDDALIDAYGAQSRNLAKGAAQYPSGQKEAERFFNDRISDNPEKLISTIRKNISGDDNYFATVDDILDAGRAKAAGLYDEAYEAVIDNSNVINAPEIQTALQKAYKQYPSKLADVEPNSIKALDYT